MRRWTSNRHRSEHPVRKRGCVLILQEHYKRNRGIKERRYVPYFFQVYFPLFWSYPHRTGHSCKLVKDCTYSLGDIIFNEL